MKRRHVARLNHCERLAGRRAGRRSTLVWEMKRYAGRLLKPLRTKTKASLEWRTSRLSENEHMRGRADPEPDRTHMPGYSIRLRSGGIWPSNRLSERMLGVQNHWLGTARPDGRSHSAPVWGSVTGTVLVSDTLRPTGTGADRIGAIDAGVVGGANKGLGRGGHQCTM